MRETLGNGLKPVPPAEGAHKGGRQTDAQVGVEGRFLPDLVAGDLAFLDALVIPPPGESNSSAVGNFA